MLLLNMYFFSKFVIESNKMSVIEYYDSAGGVVTDDVFKVPQKELILPLSFCNKLSYFNDYK